MRPLKIAVLVLGLGGAGVGFVACFHDRSFENGEIKCSTDPKRACPKGSICIDGYCVHADLSATSDLRSLFPVDGQTD